MTCNRVKVARAPIMVCLQCPLCCNLVHEATTISECLHTFCRPCIYQQLGDGENDSCPICNVSLGCSPLEKLRADHQLDDVCAKLFPIKAKRKNAINNNTDSEAPPPVRRKERSLSSLGVGAPPSSHPGYVSRRTKSVSRRSATVKDISTDEELEDKKKRTKKVVDKESSSDLKAASGDSPESHDVETSGEKETFSDDAEQDTDEPNTLQTTKTEHPLCKKRVVHQPSSQELSRAPLFSSHDAESCKLEVYLAERSKMSATGLLISQITEASNSSTKKNVNNDSEHKPVSVRGERPGKSIINQSPLAHLAEVAVDQAGQVEYLDLPKARGPRARRKNESGKSAAMGGSLSWQAMLENIRSAASPPEKKQKPKTPSPAKATPTAKKTPPIRVIGTNPTHKRLQSPALPTTKQDKQNGGFWFSLEAADNQFGENALPQIPRRYVRIKDGKLPVSILKKYLAKKFDLQSETEVEITCGGQPVVPNLSLEKVQGIWLATSTALSSMELLPALKELNAAAASHDLNNWTQKFQGSSAQDCMMVLTYARHNHHHLRQLLA